MTRAYHEVDPESRLQVNITANILAYLEEDEKMTWIVAFGLLLAVATIGNSLVTWFIIGKP